MPSLFILPFGVPTKGGVPASFGGVPDLEPGSVLCDAVALGRVGVCTRCRHWRTREKEEKRRAPVRHFVSSESIKGKMKHQPYLVYNYARYISIAHNGEWLFKGKRTVCGRGRISSCSALPPGVSAMRHRPRCHPAVPRTTSTPGYIEFLSSRT